MQSLAVSLYLLAIVTANLLVGHYGQQALVVTAFVLVPFDLVTRDVLHERWRGSLLWPKMAALIATGSILSAALSWDARSVALASFVAFGLSGVANAATYHVLDSLPRFAKMNASNAAAAVVDSVVFPLIAFASADALLCVAQASAKFAGGLFWSYLFLRLINRGVAWRQRQE